MANEEHVALLRQGSTVWNAWRKEYPEIRPDFRRADLSNADLSYATLITADFSGANLHLAELTSASLIGANLTGTNLRGASLVGTSLRDADLRFANLTDADLGYANLTGVNLYTTDLTHADISGANLSYAKPSGANFQAIHVAATTFAWIDLRQVNGLDKAIHDGPSIVDVKTVQFPEGNACIHFLQGAGFSNDFIRSLLPLLPTATQSASCFISYAHQDEMFARRLHQDLQNKGVRCWFAPEDMKIGDKIRTRIDEAIHLQDKLLLLLSEHALGSSWVEMEVEAALEKEKNQLREVLFPIRLDESVMRASQAWAKQLRRARHIGDFTHWNDQQAYQQAFDRLLRDLKVESDTKGVADGKSGASFTAETGSNAVE